MRPDQLGGKDVIDLEVNVIGDVCGIEFDSTTWTVTHICVNLSDKAITEFGYEKPRFLHISGRIMVDLPIDIIKDVSDVVTLKKRDHRNKETNQRS